MSLPFAASHSTGGDFPNTEQLRADGSLFNDRSGKRPGVTYACLYHSHQLCEGLRMAGGVVVGECGCQCHSKEKR